MKIYDKIVIDMNTLEVTEKHICDANYTGPIAQLIGGGAGGGPGAGLGHLGEGESAIPAPGEGDLPGHGLVGVPGFGQGGQPGSADSAGGEQVSFSGTGAQIGMTIGSLFGAPGMALGGLIGGVAPSAMAGSGVPGGADMSGDPTGGNAIAGPDTKAAPSVAKKVEAAPAPGKEVDITAKLGDAEKIEYEAARSRMGRLSTLLTGPLGLRGKAKIERTTLLGMG